jgi:DNA-binding NtrC family response regulator
VLIADQADAGLLLAALRAGVEDVFETPLDGRALASRVCDPPRRPPAGPGRVEPAGDAELIGDSPAMRDLKALMARVAPLPTAVLVEGEAGTGKAMVARRIHALSGRSGPFVAVDCEALAPEVLESELFGATRDAGSGVRRDREGLFVTARSGTLFLNEVSALPPAVEVKLLRALDTGVVRPAGANGEIRIDVRVIASTRQDLLARARDGRFREDLFYGLSVIHLKLPPLRRRGVDILRLAEHFGATAAAEAGLEPPVLSAAVQDRLLAHAWPGNVRELKNLVERATVLGEVGEADVGMPPSGASGGHGGYPPDWTLEEVKIDHMRRVVEACDGNKSEAARQLAVSRKTLDRKLPAG